MEGRKLINRYSLGFKQKVVNEIEEGKFSIWRAQQVYDINGSATIKRWIKRYGKSHLLSKVVRIEMKDETDKIKELEKKIKALESALANEHIKAIALESLIEVAEEHYGVDFKKNFSVKESSEAE